jgi:hypothetical protein
MPSSGTLRRVALVRADVSEEGSASIVRVTRIHELRTLAVTSVSEKCNEIKYACCDFTVMILDNIHCPFII